MPEGLGGYLPRMEPIPQTLAAIDELDPAFDDGTLLDQLTRVAERAVSVVPELVGVSVASHEHGVTFTLRATAEEIANLDGVQYLTAGPCVDAFHEGQGIATTGDDLLDEDRWRTFAQATAAAGVRSTLTFPVLDRGQVIGTVNLYAATDDAFTGKHDELARVFGAWAPGAVANADLTFSTRQLAEQAPEQLRQQALLDTAAGIVAVDHDLTVQEAHERLLDAARPAGVPLDSLARTIVELYEDGAA